MTPQDLIQILQNHPDFKIKTTLHPNTPKNKPCELTLDDIKVSDKTIYLGVQIKDEPAQTADEPPLIHQFDQKEYQGSYMHFYTRHYATKDGKQNKVYEMISRNERTPELHNPTTSITSQAICMAVHDESKEHILLLKEFRMALNRWVYNFPCGLIDKNETPEEAARRELSEETGLVLTNIIEMLPPNYTAVGFSDETVNFITATAKGTFEKSISEFEPIIPCWYTKKEVRNLLRTTPFAGRTQVYCYMWSKK